MTPIQLQKSLLLCLHLPAPTPCHAALSMPSGSLLAQCCPLRLTAIKRHSRTCHSLSFQAQALELPLSPRWGGGGQQALPCSPPSLSFTKCDFCLDTHLRESIIASRTSSVGMEKAERKMCEEEQVRTWKAWRAHSGSRTFHADSSALSTAHTGNGLHAHCTERGEARGV